MKHVSQINTDPQQMKSRPQSQPKNRPDSEEMKKLWEIMAEIYGKSLWFKMRGTIPDEKGIWSRSLKDVSPAQISRALTKLIMLECPKFIEFPPNPMEFRQICLGDPQNEHATGAYKLYKPLALDVPPEVKAKRKEAGKCALSEMRAKL